MDKLKPDRELYMRKAEMKSMKRGKSEAKQGTQANRRGAWLGLGRTRTRV